MTRARYTQVSLDSTPYYHCICRCVRRAFLCGKDAYAGKDYEHRRQWVVERLALLTEAFAVDLCAYAVMSNHYHLVIRVNRDKALSWPDTEVATRWQQLFRGSLLVERWQKGETDPAETTRAQELIGEWRERLFDLAWFMKCLNEHLARRANEEDECKGRFWESRYKCQALLDEKALLACMAYVDLNPVRAGIAATPEASQHTSFKQRIDTMKEQDDNDTKTPVLLPLVSATSVDTDDHDTLCRVRLMDYLQLVDETGRAIRADKRGVISAKAADILERLGIGHQAWLTHMQPRRRHPVAMGAWLPLKDYAQATGRRWVGSQRLASLLG